MSLDYYSDNFSFGLNKSAMIGASMTVPSFWDALWVRVVGIILAVVVVIMILLVVCSKCIKKC